MRSFDEVTGGEEFYHRIDQLRRLRKSAPLEVYWLPLRERVIEVSTRLGVVLPVYIVFTKADLLGGFKDFFAAMPRAQRQQVWGFSFSDSDRAKAMVEDLYQQQSDALMAALTAKRMAALMGERPAMELGKAVAFPGNFRQVQARFRACVSELFQPFPLGDQPLLRGVYFTSALPPMKSGPQGTILPVPTAQNLDASAPHPGSDVSIFFQAALPASPKITTDDGRSGFFLGELFSQIILGDGGIAGWPAGRSARASCRWPSAPTCLQNLIAAVHKGLLAELSTEIERTWTDTVRKPFTDQCVGKYHFDPAAKAEVDLRVFSALFNPQSGGFWRAVAEVEALRKMKIMGHELLPASVEYQRVLAQAQTLRGAHFGGEAEEMTIPFTLTLQQREAVENQVFSIGA